MIKGQVWVETVLYTLIGLALIGIVLAIITPKINSEQERILVEQSVDALSAFDEKINEVLDKGPGNVRTISPFDIGKGELRIDGMEDEIIFVLDDFKKSYSETGVLINVGKVGIMSEEGARRNSVTLTLNYEGTADLMYKGGEGEEIFESASVPYSFSIENKGDGNGDGIPEIDIREISRTG